MITILQRPLWPEICEKYFLFLPQKIYKLRQLVYVLRKVCLLFNFWLIKLTILSKKIHLALSSLQSWKVNTLSSKNIQLRQTKLSQLVYILREQEEVFFTYLGPMGSLTSMASQDNGRTCVKVRMAILNMARPYFLWWIFEIPRKLEAIQNYSRASF